MTLIEKPGSVVPTLTGECKNLSLDADEIYTSKITAPRLSSQTQKLLDESSILLAKRPKKVFSGEVWFEVTHQVFTKLIELLTLTEKLQKSLIEHGLSQEQIENLNFRNCPSEIENRLICSELEAKFGDLSGFSGFIRLESTAFRLNLAAYLRHSGIMAPKRDSKGRIYCVFVFRSIEDSRGFRLRSVL